MSSIEPLKFQVILLGVSNAGKSNIINELTNLQLKDEIDFKKTKKFSSKDFQIPKYNKTIRYNIFNLPEDEKYYLVSGNLLTNTNVIALVYDATNKQTFNNFNNLWIEYIKDSLSEDRGK